MDAQFLCAICHHPVAKSSRRPSAHFLPRCMRVEPHGSKLSPSATDNPDGKGLDFHFEDRQYCAIGNCSKLLWDAVGVADQPDYWNAYSTNLFTARACDIIRTHHSAADGAGLFLYLAYLLHSMILLAADQFCIGILHCLTADKGECCAEQVPGGARAAPEPRTLLRPIQRNDC